MSYTLLNNDGSVLAILADNTIDRQSTSLTLVGRNWIGYGQYLNQNFINILGNYSNANPPSTPLKGQLWYDSVGKRLNIYDTDFKPINGAIISATRPVDLSNGDLWWNSNSDELNILSNNILYTAGGWNISSDTVIYDVTNSFQLPATIIENDGVILGYYSNVASSIGTLNTTSVYISAITPSAVQGLNILGDIQASGVVYSNNSFVNNSITATNVTVTGNIILQGSPPSTPSSPGTVGQIAYGSTGTNFNYLFVCTATNAWARIQITDTGPW